MTNAIPKERRYKIYCMSGNKYDIDEADFQKLKANTHEMLVTLKQCVVHPASISDIAPYFVDYQKKYETCDTGGAKYIGLNAPTPIQDMFQPINNKQLT